MGSSFVNESRANVTYTITSYVDSGLVPVNGTYNGIFVGIDMYQGQLLFKNNTNTTIIVNSPVKYGQNIIINGVVADVNGNLVGGITFNVTINGTNHTVTTNSSGQWVLVLNSTSLGVGSYNIIANWAGNDYFYDFTNTSSFNVIAVITNTTINAPNTKVNRTINVTGVATDELNNSINNTWITVTINGTSQDVLTNGSGAWIAPYTPVNAGTYQVRVNWTGDTNRTGFTNTTTFNVGQLASNSTIVVNDTVKVGQNVTVSGVLINENNQIIGNTLVNVTVDGTLYTNVPVNGAGQWSLNHTTLNVGNNLNVVVTWPGDANHTGFTNATTFNVVQLGSNSTVLVNGSVEVGQNVMIRGVLTDEFGRIIGNTLVNVTVDGTLYTNVPVSSNGEWSLNHTTIRVGNNLNVVVTWAGDVNHTGFTNTTSFNVTNATDPIDPIDPVDPVDPIDPVDPVDPEIPENPRDIEHSVSYAKINKATNDIITNAVMKKTGMPIIAMILLILSIFGIGIKRRNI